MVLVGHLAAASPAAPVIAVAAGLQFTIQDLADAFAEQSGHELRIAFGASGSLARQIRAGAPYELFMAADEEFVLDLHEDGLTPDAGVIYAVGRLALIVLKGGSVSADAELEGLAQALREQRILRFAIASPSHAPYGQRAEEALRHAGLWTAIAPHLVLGENVAQAAQFVVSGNAQAGLVALSLALSPELAGRTDHAVIPDAWHQPLRQRMVLLPGSGAVAKAFYGFLQGPEAAAIFKRHGYLPPPQGA